MKIVLQKFIADSGFCSRRKAEELIRESVETRHGTSVLVNGKPAKLGIRVNEDDNIVINNKRLESTKEKIYIILNKPVRYTCTNRKFKNEKNIFELVNIKERLFAVGRLDKDSRGLLILTNDGNLAQKLTHPSFGHEKEYVVQLQIIRPRRISLGLTNDKLRIKSIKEKCLRGIDIGDGDGIVKAKKVSYLGGDKFKVILTEGKKRQIRRMFKELDFKVKDLQRVRISKIKLGNLKEGEWRNLDIKKVLKI